MVFCVKKKRMKNAFYWWLFAFNQQCAVTLACYRTVTVTPLFTVQHNQILVNTLDATTWIWIYDLWTAVKLYIDFSTELCTIIVRRSEMVFAYQQQYSAWTWFSLYFLAIDLKIDNNKTKTFERNCRNICNFC